MSGPAIDPDSTDGTDLPRGHFRVTQTESAPSAFGVAPWRVTDVYAMTTGTSTHAPGIFACLRDGNGFIVAQMPVAQAEELCVLLSAAHLAPATR